MPPEKTWVQKWPKESKKLLYSFKEHFSESFCLFQNTNTSAAAAAAHQVLFCATQWGEIRVLFEFFRRSKVGKFVHDDALVGFGAHDVAGLEVAVHNVVFVQVFYSSSCRPGGVSKKKSKSINWTLMQYSNGFNKVRAKNKLFYTIETQIND